MRIIVDEERGLVHVQMTTVGPSFERGVYLPFRSEKNEAPAGVDLRFFVPKALVHPVASCVRGVFGLWLACRLGEGSRLRLFARFSWAFRAFIVLLSMSIGWAWGMEDPPMLPLQTHAEDDSRLDLLHLVSDRFSERPSYREESGKIFLIPTRFTSIPPRALFLLPSEESDESLERRWILSDAESVTALLILEGSVATRKATPSPDLCGEGMRWWALPKGTRAVLVAEGKEAGEAEMRMERISERRLPLCPSSSSSSSSSSSREGASQ